MRCRFPTGGGGGEAPEEPATKHTQQFEQAYIQSLLNRPERMSWEEVSAWSCARAGWVERAAFTALEIFDAGASTRACTCVCRGTCCSIRELGC